MKKLLLPFLVAALAFAMIIPAAAQDATATPDAASGTTDTTVTTDTTMQGMGTLSCDSSTILLAGLAQRYFGYMPMDVTLGDYVYGQYSPLFDTQGITGSTMAEPTIDPASGAVVEPTVDPASGAVVESTLDPAGAAGSPTLVPNSVFLSSPVVTGEDPACTQLRASLEAFFSTQLQSGDWDTNFRSDMSGMGATGNG